MKYHTIIPYHINKTLKKKGWIGKEDGIYIPTPFIYEQEKRIWLKIKKEKKYFIYISFEEDADEKFKKITTIIRDTNLYDDVTHEKGQRVDNYRIYISEPIEKSLRFLFPSARSDEIKSFLNDIIHDIKNANCLDILLRPYCNTYEFDNFQKNQSELIEQFQHRKHVGKARQKLANWLKTRFDVILRKNSHDIYILDEDNNCYTEMTHDELLYKVSEILGPQLINDDDLKWALSYISDRLDPQHNIVKFSDCVFDMEKLKVNHTNKPIFTLVETPYRFNPNAKSKYLEKFLKSSLHKETIKETDEVVKGVKQVVGYLFTSGNKLNLLPMITGIAGGGKSVFANILIAIFGKDKIADLKLQEIEKNTHATSSLVNKHLNIIQDSDDSAINNNSLIKQITGNDPLQVNPKHQDPFVLAKEEVPKSVLICNSLPYFKKLEPALLERFLIIEFNVKFRGTDKENPNLLNEILENPEEIEWFIFESIQAYKEMLENGEDFILRKDGEATRKLVDKHQNPVNYVINQMIIKHDPEINTASEKDPKVSNADYPIFTQDLNATIIEFAKEKGIELTLNRKGEIGSKFLINTIRYEFDLPDTYVTQTIKGKRYYPDLITNDTYWNTLNKISPKAVPDEIKKALKLETPNQENYSKEGENKTKNA